MPEIIEQFVDYYIYCKTCKHKDLENWKDPCNECIETPVHQYSSKPINYEKAEDN